MTGREFVRELMGERDVTIAQLARTLGITQQTLWARVSNKASQDLNLPVFFETVQALDYEIVVRPKHEKYVGGEEHVLNIEKASNANGRGRPKKEK